MNTTFFHPSFHPLSKVSSSKDQTFSFSQNTKLQPVSLPISLNCGGADLSRTPCSNPQIRHPPSSVEHKFQILCTPITHHPPLVTQAHKRQRHWSLCAGPKRNRRIVLKALHRGELCAKSLSLIRKPPRGTDISPNHQTHQHLEPSKDMANSQNPQ